MALLKDKKLSSNVVINFWMLTITDINWTDKTLRVVVSGYLSRADFDSGAVSLDEERRGWFGDDFPLDKTQPNTVEQLYIKLKESVILKDGDTGKDYESNFFIDAVDDIL